MFMTQPAVTVAIQEIERYYGVLLFDRIGRRLYLTEAGKEFREYAVRIQSMLEDMEAGLKSWNRAGKIRVGASITIGSWLMPSYVEKFSRENPQVDVRVWIAPSYELEKKILDNELDLALVETSVHDSHIVAEAFMEDSLTVITPARLPYHMDQIFKKAQFASERFLLREKGSGARELFDQVMEGQGLCVEPVWEGISSTALINGVSKGLGISVLPERMVAEARERGEVYGAQVEGMEFRRNFYIIYHKDKRLTNMLGDFMEVCRGYGDLL